MEEKLKRFLRKAGQGKWALVGSAGGTAEDVSSYALRGFPLRSESYAGHAGGQGRQSW